LEWQQWQGAPSMVTVHTQDGSRQSTRGVVTVAAVEGRKKGQGQFSIFLCLMAYSKMKFAI
jgi:hypothetical protein